MHTTSTITKTVFIEAFKTCNKYLKCNYIDQETFFHNMIHAMICVKRQSSGNEAVDFKLFDDVALRKEIVGILKTMGPTYWRDYENLSKKLKDDAKSYFFTAGTDAAGIFVGMGMGKAVGKVTKQMSRPYSKTLLKAGQSNGNRIKVSYRRLNNTKHVPTQFDVKTQFKTQNTIWGRDIFHGKITKDTTVEISLNSIEIADNIAIGTATEEVHQNIAPGESFSFGNTETKFGYWCDKITDYVPYVGVSKAVVSSAVNIAIGYEYSKTAKLIEEQDMKNIEADRKFIQEHLYADIKSDLKAMDKKQLFNMWLFAIKQSNI